MRTLLKVLNTKLYILYVAFYNVNLCSMCVYINLFYAMIFVPTRPQQHVHVEHIRVSLCEFVHASMEKIYASDQKCVLNKGLINNVVILVTQIWSKKYTNYALFENNHGRKTFKSKAESKSGWVRQTKARMPGFASTPFAYFSHLIVLFN